MESDSHWTAYEFGLDQDRVLSVYKRTVHEFKSFVRKSSRRSSFESDTYLRPVFKPDLGLALRFNKYGKAECMLTFFERSDLLRLARLEQFAVKLANDHSMIYDIFDWERLLFFLINHHRRHYSSFLETGYPKPGIEREQMDWHNWRFERFYPVKFIGYSCSVPGWFRTTIIDGEEKALPCPYEKADYIPFLNANDAMRLGDEILRKKVLDTKGSVLGFILNEIGEREGKQTSVGKAMSSVKGCLQCISSFLNPEEVNFLLKMDVTYEKRLGFHGISEHRKHITFDPGGLSALLDTIGYIGEELALGLNSTIHDSIEDHKLKDTGIGVVLRLEEFYKDLLEDRIHWLEDLYHKCETMQPDIDGFWDEFTKLIKTQCLNSDLAEGFNPSSTIFAGSNDALRKSGPPLFKIIEDDSSIVYDSNKYCLPDKHFRAVVFMANSHIAGNPWIHKSAIHEECDVNKKSMCAKSIFKWFVDYHGAPERFAKDGLIKTNPNHDGSCQLDVEPEQIKTIPAQKSE